MGDGGSYTAKLRVVEREMAPTLLLKLLKLLPVNPLLQPGQDHVYCAHYEGY